MNTWNTKRYSSRTLSVFEITGAYFANIFYNHLYKTAKDRHNISSRSGYSLTDEYKAAVSAYKHGITKDKKSYEQTVKDLLQYYRTVTKFITASMNDFIETILQQFIPEEHYVTLNDNEKFFFMNKILSTIVTNAASDMVSMKYLELIIDLRHEDNSISMCKDRIVEIQCLERDTMFGKFIKQEIGATNSKKSRSKQHKDLLEESEKIDINLCKQLREDCETLYQKYQELLMAKCELEAAENRAKKIVETLHEEIFKLSKENLRLKKELNEQRVEKRLSNSTTQTGNSTQHNTNQLPMGKSSEVFAKNTPTNKSAEKKQPNDVERIVTPRSQGTKPAPIAEPQKEEIKNNRRKKVNTEVRGRDKPTKQIENKQIETEESSDEEPLGKPAQHYPDDDLDEKSVSDVSETDDDENSGNFTNRNEVPNGVNLDKYENSPFLQDLE